MPPEPLKVGDIVRTGTVQAYGSIEVPVGAVGVVVRFNERALAWPYTVAFEDIPRPDGEDWLYAESELELVVDHASDGGATENDPVSQREFKVGDRVRLDRLTGFNHIDSEVPVGTEGVIVRMNAPWAAVPWPGVLWDNGVDVAVYTTDLDLVGSGVVEQNDPVNHPSHYTSHPSGVECIQITEHMDFLTGNAVKYLWRTGKKGPAVEDLKKARWYLDRAIQKAEKGAEG